MHARYSRIEILAAFGIGNGAKVAAVANGVYEAKSRQRRAVGLHARQEQRRLLPDHPLPRLRHQPHAHPLGEPVDDPGRQRHGSALPNHERDGRSIMLFTRLRADDRAFWFLGPATYRGHVGDKPMAITWELDTPLPGDLYQSFAAAVA